MNCLIYFGRLSFSLLIDGASSACCLYYFPLFHLGYADFCCFLIFNINFVDFVSYIWRFNCCVKCQNLKHTHWRCCHGISTFPYIKHPNFMMLTIYSFSLVSLIVCSTKINFLVSSNWNTEWFLFLLGDHREYNSPRFSSVLIRISNTSERCDCFLPRISSVAILVL